MSSFTSPRNRWLWCAALAATWIGCLASAASAQQPPLRLKIDKIQVGFQSYDREGGDYYHAKPDLWAPVHVTLAPAPDGNVVLPVGVDDFVRGKLLVEAPDNDGVGNTYTQDFAQRKNDDLQLLSFVKAPAGSSVKISVRQMTSNAEGKLVEGEIFENQSQNIMNLQVNDHLYLTAGARLADFKDALDQMLVKQKGVDEIRHRHGSYEIDARRLPTEWFGYNGIDLLLLTTNSKEFLNHFRDGASLSRRKALAEWVRRGGRLVVSVCPRHLDEVGEWLKDATVWQPPLPPLLKKGQARSLTGVFKLPTWAGVATKPFPDTANDDPWVVPLNQRDDIQELIKEVNGSEETPLMTRVPYGLGSVTVLAFDLQGGKDAPFGRWNGRTDFYKAMFVKLAPRLMTGGNDQHLEKQMRRPGPRGGFQESVSNDLTARLSDELDQFDTAPISFGWVAFFIFLYILVVGPLDYLILKKVFKRLEWTWFTFPTVVLVVSVAAYLIAYAVKGNELKINKIDLLDIDLRSDLDEQQQTRRAHVYGTSWFTLLSPRIQSYTIGIEPRVNLWADPAAKESLAPAMVSWLPRPEGGYAARQKVQGLFRRNYEYNAQALGLKDVPIPVWATKAFVASWEASLKKVPLLVKLEYDPEAPNATLPTGTIKSLLPFDLIEVGLFYGNKWYPLSDLPANGEALTLKLENRPGEDLNQWAQPRERDRLPPQEPAQFQPTPFVRDLLFHEKADLPGAFRNHAQRFLDQSWRLIDDLATAPRTHEAILFARVPQARGQTQELTARGDPSLPTHLWLGQLPGAGQERPQLDGTLIQDTYVRIYLPVRPKPVNPK